MINTHMGWVYEKPVQDKDRPSLWSTWASRVIDSNNTCGQGLSEQQSEYQLSLNIEKIEKEEGLPRIADLQIPDGWKITKCGTISDPVGYVRFEKSDGTIIKEIGPGREGAIRRGLDLVVNYEKRIKG